MDLKQVVDSHIYTSEILARHAKSAQTSIRRHYLATQGALEVGLLRIDVQLGGEFVIYEIFVPATLRRKGFGSLLLQQAEDMARQMDYGRTLVVPRTLDSSFEQQSLEKWYARKGYLPLHGSSVGQLVKQIG